MQKAKLTVLIFCFCLIYSIQLSGQGISRSYGLGFRGGFWKRKDKTMSVQVSSSLSQQGTVDVGGVGGTVYFFSRIAPRWFIETSIGASADVHIEEKDFFSSSVDVAVLSPLLFGFRFDMIPTRIPTSVQPYLSGGIGPYWMMKTMVEDEFIFNNDVTVESDLNFGAYAGTGMHLTLGSWFGFNFDFKYHFVDLKPNHAYSGFEIGTGIVFMWGKKQEIFRVEAIQILVRDIYPAYYQFYNTYPLAMVSIQNTAGYPIEVNIKSNIKGYSERVRESGFVKIQRGEKAEIPILAFFGQKLLDLSTSERAVIDLDIEARAGVSNKKSISAEIMLHSRNAWNGDMDKLGYFLTPEDPAILEFSREVVKEISDSLYPGLEKYQIARHLFGKISNLEIIYQSDPNIPFYRDDRVQFAEKTLSLGTGDCDDLVVLYASLLESQGIDIAFVDVQDPEKDLAHVYLLFNTDLAPDQAGLISSNEKRYVIRENERTGSSVWIPIETTLIQNSFDEAWNAGAMQYLQEGILRHGLAEGWVRVVDPQ